MSDLLRNLLLVPLIKERPEFVNSDMELKYIAEISFRQNFLEAMISFPSWFSHDFNNGTNFQVTQNRPDESSERVKEWA